MPAIVDHDAPDGPTPVFELGAILISARWASNDRCLGVLEHRSNGQICILDEYSIADMICCPWVLIAKPLGQSLDEFPDVSRRRDLIKSRPAVQRGVDVGKDMRRTGLHTEEARRILFGQTAWSFAGSGGAG